MKSSDIPQADNLDTVRVAVAAVAAGARDLPELARRTGFSTRHTGYRVGAAVTLGLVEQAEAGFHVTSDGRRLLTTDEGGFDERDCFAAAILGSPVIAKVAPGLLESDGPTRDGITVNITVVTGLARTTAHRRAGTLLSWRRRLGVDESSPLARTPEKGPMERLVSTAIGLLDPRVPLGILTRLLRMWTGRRTD